VKPEKANLKIGEPISVKPEKANCPGEA